jgi:type I restriction enzyme M protein
MDMPEGYKHFSKTKPMLLQHAEPIRQWWETRNEIVDEENNDEKSRCFSVDELMTSDCDFDRCKFPKDEEEVLPPQELLTEYYKKRKALEHQIDKTLNEIQEILGFKIDID